LIDKYTAIIFDWDGTLVDTCGLILDAHNHVRGYMDQPLWTMDDFMGRASQSAREYYPQIYGDRADEAQKVLYDFVEEHHLTYLKAMNNAAEILSSLSRRGTPLGVVSNKRHTTLHKEIEAMGWQDYFTASVGAGHAIKDKPAADPLLLAIKAIDGMAQPSDILYVGDTETDLLCAKNAACPVALVQSDKPRPDLIEKYKPDYAWEDLSPLLEQISEKTPQMTANKA
jgi:phosphoglycolate phosphatase